jgi:peptidoglycan/LPS O-acetylase OafA/YrhL
VSSTSWKIRYVPALDGFRGFAILAVVFFHLNIWQGLTSAGGVGVTMFFTLSGFLITALLLRERTERGSINLRVFYARRIRRLFPGLLALLATVALVDVIYHDLGHLVFRVLPAATYMFNWIPAGGGAPDFWVNHTWSLSIEEQFYLIWPLTLIILLRLGKERAALTFVVVGIVCSSLERMLLWHSGLGFSRIYFGSDTRADALLYGCGLAIWSFQRGLPKAPKVLAWGACISLFLLSSLFLTGALSVLLGLSLTALASMVLISGLCSGHLRAFGAPLPRFIGRISYSLYIWHLPVINVLDPILGRIPTPLRIIAELIGCLIVASASYYIIERRFLRPGIAAREAAKTGTIVSR